LAPVATRVVPVPMKSSCCSGSGAWLGEAVATGDALDTRLGLGGIVDHFCELGLDMNGESRGKGEGKGRYLKSGEIHSLLGYMVGRERGYKIVDGYVHG
jgi:hypothetical protein